MQQRLPEEEVKGSIDHLDLFQANFSSKVLQKVLCFSPARTGYIVRAGNHSAALLVGLRAKIVRQSVFSPRSKAGVSDHKCLSRIHVRKL